jgi:uncharacterized protein (TIGR00369 family)
MENTNSFKLDKSELDKLNRDNRYSLMDTLHIQCVYASNERIEAIMPVDAGVCQPFGILHGGATISLAETVAGIGSYLLIDKGMMGVGLQVSANHISSAKVGDTVHAVCTLLHKGKTTHVWNIDVLSSTDNRLISTVRVTNVIVKVKEHSIDDGEDDRS